MAHPSKAFLLLVGAAAALTGGAVSTDAKAKTVQGTILRFECGDNCYLVILDKAKEERTGLCAAPQCAQWNENAAMPKRLVGKRVRVTVGTGSQVDGNGTVQGEFPSFTAISFPD